MPPKQELPNVLLAMREVSNAFYAAASQVGNHAFIEFTGFMNEYIRVCETTLAAGKDFTASNIHTDGDALVLREIHAEYMGEKFSCVFEKSFKLKHVAAFCRKAFSAEVSVEKRNGRNVLVLALPLAK
jgi:hypothetical protein